MNNISPITLKFEITSLDHLARVTQSLTECTQKQLAAKLYTITGRNLNGSTIHMIQNGYTPSDAQIFADALIDLLSDAPGVKVQTIGKYTKQIIS